ncbi:helix-turn-helix domain-containing protein [Desulfovibrio psychrotolerans]|uniref:HTH cro/C1-type domain-containing protein n=1 Tax=Desulfovibrio psychrotolerans TaxID=415242 RepID=A0A7J0BPJ2_9BACT|nr:helix-turn-helix domain-containing protein [Desulfovibrio psychrotolerans]GFM35560.1 hypothetical protein DSM19430T_02440 [Desulfovibrio psychrotolerans]
MTTMTELGAQLCRARESKGLTHEDVARRIKVAARTLVALETGNMDDLPHAVYTKGFVKSYARLLGLDSDEYGQAMDVIYARELGDQEEQEVAFVSRRLPPPKPRWHIPVLILFVCVVAAGGGWYFFVDSRSSSAVNELAPQGAVEATPAVPQAGADGIDPTSPQVQGETEAAPEDGENTVIPNEAGEAPAPAPETELPAPAPQGSLSVPATEAARTAGASMAASVPAEVEALVVGDSEATTVGGLRQEQADELVATTSGIAPEPVEAVAAASSAETAVSAGGASYGPAVMEVPLKPGSGEQKLTLTASSECWVEVWGTGVERREMYLRAGQKSVLRFPAQLNLKLGNSGGVTVTLNDRNVPMAGEEGKVLTLHFISAQ